MKDLVYDAVTTAIAGQLGLDPLAIEPRQELRHDLGLDRFALRLITSQINEALDLELPFRAVRHVRNVGGLLALARRRARRRRPRVIHPARRDMLRGIRSRRGGERRRELPQIIRGFSADSR